MDITFGIYVEPTMLSPIIHGILGGFVTLVVVGIVKSIREKGAK